MSEASSMHKYIKMIKFAQISDDHTTTTTDQLLTESEYNNDYTHSDPSDKTDNDDNIDDDKVFCQLTSLDIGILPSDLDLDLDESVTSDSFSDDTDDQQMQSDSTYSGLTVSPNMLTDGFAMSPCHSGYPGHD